MKRTIVTVAIMALTLPAAADVAGTIDRSQLGSPLIGEVDSAGTDLRYTTIGRFFVVEFPDGTQQSTEIPADAVAFHLSDDGTVTFTLGEVPEEYDEPVPDVSAEEWEEHTAPDPEPEPEPEPEPAPTRTPYVSAGVYLI